jgi:hypothetical protein
MKRRLALAVFGTLLCSGAVAANPSAAEAARIDKLIAAVGKRDDIKFIRNGSEYNCNQAADFLRGKLKWRIDKVVTVQDFIDQIGTRSTTSGEIYQVQLPDGKKMPSAEFLRQELARIEQR